MHNVKKYYIYIIYLAALSQVQCVCVCVCDLKFLGHLLHDLLKFSWIPLECKSRLDQHWKVFQLH